MLNKKIKEELEFGFYNELHADPFCLDIEIHALEGHKTADIILTSWELYDETRQKKLSKVVGDVNVNAIILFLLKLL